MNQKEEVSFFLHCIITKLDLIDSESKETDDKGNQHGSQGKSQSNRGADRGPLSVDAIVVDDQGEEGENFNGEEVSAGKIPNITTQIIISNYSQVRSLAAPGGRRSHLGHWRIQLGHWRSHLGHWTTGKVVELAAGFQRFQICL